MSLLSDRQRDELNKSILDYFKSQDLPEAYQAFKAEANIDFEPDPKAKYAGLLEKKWTSVIRLQKKILDLENRNSSLMEQLSLSPARRAASQSDWVPRSPAGRTLSGHRAPIIRVAFHPVFSLLVSASEDATIKVWDWETGEFERTLKGHTKPVQDVEFDSKGNYLVSCSSDLTIKIWDSANEYKNTKTLYGHDHSISMARFLSGDTFIVSASRDRTIKIWEVSNGFCVKTFTGHSEWVRCIVPSDDGKLLASGSKDQTARIWDATSGETKMELRGHEHDIEAVAFAPPVAYSAIRTLAGIAVRMTYHDLQKLRLIHIDSKTTERSKQPGAYIATGSRDKTIKLWDAASGGMLRSLAGHDNWVRALVFHPTGKFLLSASDDKTIRVWDLASGRCIKTVEAHGHFVTCMAWGRATSGGAPNPGDNPESKANGIAPQAEAPRLVNVVATGSIDQTIKVWTP